MSRSSELQSRRALENSSHPILDGIEDFEIGDEVWAQNIAPAVTCLLFAGVGDRIPCHQRFRQPIPICGCSTSGKGRLLFFSLGHYAQTYTDPNVVRLLGNGLSWLTGLLSDNWDLFLSYSSRDQRDAERFASTALDEFGLRVFLAGKELEGGDAWPEAVRTALIMSRELCVLVTPNGIASEWVTTEWGAAWALKKRTTPLLLRCDVTQLPERLRSLQAQDFHEYPLYLQQVKDRRQALR